MVKEYVAYLKKTISWLRQLSRDEQLPLLWCYWDYAKSVVSHRCLIRQYVIGEFWKKSSRERSRCLTYHRMCKLFAAYNQPAYVHFLNEKPDFNAYFKPFVKRAWLHLKGDALEAFKALLEKHKTLIVKPVDGVEGGGVRKLSMEDCDLHNLRPLFDELVRENVLVEEIIQQHPRMVFGNTSVNTIRTHTILDDHGKAHVVKAILRAGVGDSVVDNYCQGGSIYEVDVKTGLVCTYGQSKSNSQSYIHPGTDIVMLGYRIPNWDKVIEGSEKAAEMLPQIRIIGWDVAITEDGIELIEGNHNPDYELFEFLGSTGYYSKIKSALHHG